MSAPSWRRCARRSGAGDRERDSAPSGGVLRAGERPPKMIYPVVVDLAAEGIAVAVACRVLGVSRSGFYEWRDRPPSPRALADEALGTTIGQIHRMSRGAARARRAAAGRRRAVRPQRVARLMRSRSRGLTITRDLSVKTGAS